jgi:hypothetical protein
MYLFTYLQRTLDVYFSDIPLQVQCHTLAAIIASGIFVTFMLLHFFAWNEKDKIYYELSFAGVNIPSI